jgi:glycosyltransferase involved in cell wall biosynthesis
VNGPRLLTAASLAVRGRVPMLFHAHHHVGQKSARYVEGVALRRSVATVAACCEAVAQSLRGSVPEERIHVIPNGTEDLGFVERTFEKHRERRLGMIGRIAVDKGQTEFLRAAAQLVERGSRARFVICGAPLFGDRSYYDGVLRMAAGLPVEFLDWQDSVASVMRDLDILVMPSQQEGMPRVLLEAISAGLPVVAFPVDGIPEVIEDGVTGFLARGELIDKLQEVLDADPETLRGVARSARRLWEQRHQVAMYRERVTTLMERCVLRGAREIIPPQRRRSATQR